MRKPSLRSVVHAAAVAFLCCAPSWSQAACEVTDPVGDFLGHSASGASTNPCNGPGCEPWHDIVQASVVKDGLVFRLSMTLAEAVPPAPPLRPGGKKAVWAWNLDTNPATSPQGYPFGPSTVAGPEFIARVVWDGVSFSGIVIDRRPLLTGGQAIEVLIAFQVNGAVVSATLDASLLGNPSSLSFRGATQDYLAFDGTGGFFAEDRTNITACTW